MHLFITAMMPPLERLLFVRHILHGWLVGSSCHMMSASLSVMTIFSPLLQREFVFLPILEIVGMMLTFMLSRLFSEQFDHLLF